MTYVNQAIMLYILNLHSYVCNYFQLNWKKEKKESIKLRMGKRNFADEPKQ